MNILGIERFLLKHIPSYFTCSDYLSHLNERYEEWMQLPYKERYGDGLKDVNELMQDKFPGPYYIAEKRNPITGKCILKMEFYNNEDSTIWVLKGGHD